MTNDRGDTGEAVEPAGEAGTIGEAEEISEGEAGAIGEAEEIGEGEAETIDKTKKVGEGETTKAVDADLENRHARQAFVPSALLTTLALLMFVGGALVTLSMMARAFALHGTALVAFVVVSCAVVLGLAGSLLLRTMGDKAWIGGIIGACFGAISAILVYSQTRHYDWWR